MLTVGITGGMGTGKSTVCKIWECLHIPILNTDALSKKLMVQNTQLRKSIITAFGADVYSNNNLNTKLLAQKAFANSTSTNLLNSIVHPYVFAAIDEWQKKQTGIYSIRESALLIESGSYKNLDVLIGIKTPLPIRLQRIMARDNCTEMEALTRIQKQMDESQKEKFYDYTILNFEPNFVIPQVLQIHQQLLKK